MAITCLFDNTLHETVEDLHRHLRRFNVKQEDYYTEYHPKKDLLTGEPIPYKNVDQYLSANFINKNTMKTWYKKNPKEAVILSISMLKERILRKNLKRLPGEVELMSCGLPSSQYYYEFIAKDVESAGLRIPYNYSLKSLEMGVSNPEIIVDTREQSPLRFKDIVTRTETLKYGDYTIDNHPIKLTIERKSLSDLLSSCVAQYERFQKEFQRAHDAGAYLVTVCEESLNTALNYPFIPYFRKYTKVRPEAVFHNIRALTQDFGFQFLFCDGRVSAAETVLKLFKTKTDVRTIDLQWAYSRAKIL